MRSDSVSYFLELLLEMSTRNLKIRYKRTYVGFLWTILIPTIQMAAMGIIFSYFINRPNYYLFLFAGLLPWQFFTASVYSMTSSLIQHRTLIRKASFPREVIPLSELCSHFVFFLVAYLLFFIYCIFVLKTNFLLLFTVVLPGIIWITVVAVGLGLLTAALNVRYRDVQYLVNASFIPWFYATPILYGTSDIPERILRVVWLNPLYSAFSWLHGAVSLSPALPPYVYWINIAETMLLLFLGISFFKRNQATFVDHV